MHFYPLQFKQQMHNATIYYLYYYFFQLCYNIIFIILFYSIKLQYTTYNIISFNYATIHYLSYFIELLYSILRTIFHWISLKCNTYYLLRPEYKTVFFIPLVIKQPFNVSLTRILEYVFFFFVVWPHCVILEVRVCQTDLLFIRLIRYVCCVGGHLNYSSPSTDKMLLEAPSGITPSFCCFLSNEWNMWQSYCFIWSNNWYMSHCIVRHNICSYDSIHDTIISSEIFRIYVG